MAKSPMLISMPSVVIRKAALRTYPNHVAEYLNPLVIVAYVLFVGCTLLTILAYQGIPLSLGPVLEATSYLYVTVFGVTIFHEHVGREKLLALALIVIGIVVFATLG